MDVSTRNSSAFHVNERTAASTQHAQGPRLLRLLQLHRPVVVKTTRRGECSDAPPLKLDSERRTRDASQAPLRLLDSARTRAAAKDPTQQRMQLAAITKAMQYATDQTRGLERSSADAHSAPARRSVCPPAYRFSRGQTAALLETTCSIG